MIEIKAPNVRVAKISDVPPGTHVRDSHGDAVIVLGGQGAANCAVDADGMVWEYQDDEIVVYTPNPADDYDPEDILEDDDLLTLRRGARVLVLDIYDVGEDGDEDAIGREGRVSRCGDSDEYDYDRCPVVDIDDSDLQVYATKVVKL